jgi:hypothetical protein
LFFDRLGSPINYRPFLELVSSRFLASPLELLWLERLPFRQQEELHPYQLLVLQQL